MERVEVHRGDVTLSCLHGGRGPDTVVLLHGLAGAAAELLPTAAALLDDHRVIAPDLRGHGHSTRRPADLSRRAFAADVAAVIETLAGTTPVTLVGQSMGAHTAMLTAAWHPHLVGALVMLEGGVGGDPDGSDYPSRLGRWFASWPVPFATPQDAVTFLGGTPTAHAWAADLEPRPDGWWPRFDADIMQATMTPVAATPFWPEWRSLTIPTLLVRAANGTVPQPEADEMQTLRPGLSQALIPDAGHDAHLDQPTTWHRILTTFLTSP